MTDLLVRHNPYTHVERPPVAVMLHQALALFRAGDLDAAENLYSTILLDDPGNPHALHILGLIVSKRGDYDLAEQLIRRAVQIEPHSRAWLNLGVIRQHRGLLNEAIACYRQAVALEPEYSEAWANLLFALDMHPYATWQQIKDTREAFDAAICGKLTALSPPHQNDRDPERRLRVGYVSGDFRTSHSASMTMGWITRHDPAQIEVYLYSTYESEDATMQPFKDRADVWCEIGHLSEPELAQVIRDDAIDILVDLAGASKGGRPLVFALKPAPIQVGGWGYPHALGMQAMDYIAGDRIATPPAHADRYRERVMPVPSVLGYSPPSTLPDVGPFPQERNGYRTYGYLGRPNKVSEACLATWAEILRRDPTSRLLLKSGQYADRLMRERVLDCLSALGVALERIEVRGVTSRQEHLEAHRDVDVCLDSIPQTGCATTGDALLMGVPVVTLAGETVTHRTGASILTAVGLGEWAVPTIQAYIHRAMDQDLPPRMYVRDSLRGSILCDHEQYARAVEDAYRTIWREWATSPERDEEIV